MPAGTIALTNNSTAVTGTGTSFTAELKANDFIVTVVGGVTYTLGVQSVNSATSVTLTTAYNGPTASGVAWTALPNSALVAITAQVAADVAKAIRGLNLDKANWQQVYSASGNITVTLPDGSQFSGPSWNYLSTQLGSKANSSDVLTKQDNLNSVADKKTARTNLAATTARVLTEGSGNDWYGSFASTLDLGMKLHADTPNTVSPWDAPSQYSLVNYFPSPNANVGTAIASTWGSSGDYWLNSRNSAYPGYQGWKGWSKLWHSRNTTVDSNGFIKRASPIVKLFSDGTCEVNDQASGVTSERVSEGVYRITGTQGFNSDAAWGGPDGGIGLPKDRNDLALLWVDYEVGVSGDLLIKTFHREHRSAPAFARNEVTGYEDGAPIDIPAGRWVDLRVEVYSKEEAPVDEPGSIPESNDQQGS
ncbi:phage tail protein [Pantoea agglomerans]|uniref:phage tail fiber protein n=1 Tax=Enterobacter agglomerans TaxID=549 RepID=UPI00117FF02E|nr:phage tail protein [Pantoea agglomerans]NKE95214.1 phage tail protein [Pantoea agglomerans]TRO76752.1 phage tail protein [Pantoea agglomerans]